MREALAEFLQEVRRAGVPVSVAESIDALRAATLVPAERERLREALAATVVKDEADRAAFDEVFDRFFSGGAAERRGRGRRQHAGGAEPASGGRGREGVGFGASRPDAHEPRGTASGAQPWPPGAERLREETEPHRKPEPPGTRGPRREETRARHEELRPGREEIEPRPDAVSRREREVRRETEALRRRRRRRALLRKPFRELDPLEAEELPALAAEISRRFRARLRRRLRRGARGRLDFRRTLRGSVSRGGAAVDLFFRRRRPGRIDLVALCDVSGSVRHASEFFVAVLGPSVDWFRRVRLFGFIDRLVEADIENGRLLPHGAIDFHAFSDFGRVLVDFEETRIPLGRNTVLLVLGDARNNRRPARADVLARLRTRVRAIWWLDPESRDRWGTGDSAIGAYRPHCDAVLECADGASLLRALDRLTR